MENIYIYIYLALNYSAQPYIAVHCSKVGKKYTYIFTTTTLFLIYSGAKNSFLAF